jgi:hypothetical protein
VPELSRLHLGARRAALVGAALVFVGFAYDTLFAGIPPQDPPPNVAAAYLFHAGVASWIMRVGGAALFGGLVVGAFGSMVRRRKMG